MDNLGQVSPEQPVRRRIITEISKKVDEVVDQNLLIPDSPVTDWISTGCTILDLALADKLPGGIPVGRVSGIHGGASTCKSVLASTLLGYAQRSGKVAYYNDVEHTFNPVWAAKYGLDYNNVDTFRLGHPETLEDLFDVHLDGLLKSKDKRPKVSVTDSVTALTSEDELENDLEKGTYGSIAKLMSRGFRKYNPKRLDDGNVTLVLIDQTRDNVGGGLFGPDEIVPGGRAKEFYFSTRIYLRAGDKVENKDKKVIGIWVRFTIAKNKVAPPFRQGKFRILFDYGLDDIVSNLMFLKEYQLGLKEAKNATNPVVFQDEEKKVGSWTKIIEDEGLEKELQRDVEKVWHEMYKAEERKRRQW